MDKFKYKTVFSSVPQIVKPTKKLIKEAKASVQDLKNLKSLIPSDINLNANPDCIYCVANLCTPNLVNLNGSVITTESALEIADSFKHKYINYQHDRTFVVGTILDVGFSDFETSKLITPKDLVGYNKPFNMAISFVLWRVISEGLCEEVELGSNEESPNFGQYSLSWEVAYSDVKLAKGSKYLNECEIIDDKNIIDSYLYYCREFGGSGLLEDGTPISVVLSGDLFSLGAGIVTTPAAKVRGIHCISPEIPEEDLILDEENNMIDIPVEFNNDIKELAAAINKYKEDELSSEEIKNKLTFLNSSFNKNTEGLCQAVASDHYINKCSCGKIISQCRCGGQKTENIIKNGCDECKKEQENKQISESHANSKEKSVKDNETTKIMKISKITDITDETLKEVKASAITSFISEELNKEMTKYAAEKDELQAELDKQKKDAESLAAKLEEFESVKVKLVELEDSIAETQKEKADADAKIAEVQASLDAEVAARSAREAQDKFDERMENLTASYEFSDEMSAAIAKKIQGLNDEDYASYLDEQKPFFKTKIEEKPVILESKASINTSFDDILEDLTKNTEKKVVVNVISKEKSVNDNVQAAFGDLLK